VRKISDIHKDEFNMKQLAVDSEKAKKVTLLPVKG